MNTIEICGAKTKMKQIIRDVNSNLNNIHQYSNGRVNNINNNNYKNSGTTNVSNVYLY